MKMKCRKGGEIIQNTTFHTMFKSVTVSRKGRTDILNSSHRDHLLTSAPPPSFHYQPSLLNLVEFERNGGKEWSRSVSGQRAAFVYQPQRQHGRNECHITADAHLVS